jgi:hypothetical protein
MSLVCCSPASAHPFALLISVLGPVSGTAGVMAGADGLVSARQVGRGRRATRALAGAVPRRSRHDHGESGKGGAAGRRRAGAAGPGAQLRAAGAARRGPAAAGTPSAGILPSQACRRLFCPPGSRFGRHHRRSTVASLRPHSDPGPGSAPVTCLSRPFPGFLTIMSAAAGAPRPPGREWHV